MRNSRLFFMGIVSCLSLGMLSGCGNFTSVVKNAAMSKEETEKEEYDLDSFDNVTVDLECAYIEIKHGDSYHLSISRTENYVVNAQVDEGELDVHSEGDMSNESGYSATVAITIPKDTAINEANINLAVGDFFVENISISKLTSTQSTGDFTAQGCDISDANVEISVGTVNFVNSGTLEDTIYDLDANVGDIVVYGNEEDSPFKNGTGTKTVMAKTSVGDIIIE